MILVQIPILFLLILVNGVFAMAELALIGARRTKLQAAAANGDEGARRALALLRESHRFISTVSIGITLVSIIVSTVGGDSFVRPLNERLQEIPLLQPYAHALSIGIVVLGNAFLSLVAGELVPKRIALAHPELLAARLARLMTVVSQILRPAEWLLSGTSAFILRWLPLKTGTKEPMSDEEISLIMREGAAAGAFHPAESSIVQMVLRLGDRRLDAIMTPRMQIEFLDLEDGWAVNRDRIRNSPYTRFPVVSGGPETVLGVLHMKDLVAANLDRMGDVDLAQYIRPPLYVPNTVPALKFLEELKKSGEPLALVVDEYGDLDGVVTVTDILQALVGEIATPGEQHGEAITRRDDGSWLVSGLTSIDEVKDAIGLPYLADEESGDFHTLGGFVMQHMKRVPNVADHIDVDGWRFEVVGMDGHRVDRVMVVPPATHPPAQHATP